MTCEASAHSPLASRSCQQATASLLTRVGFVLEGALRKRWVAKGAAYDTNVYGCLVDEWLAGRAAG